MKISKALLGAILVGVAVQTTTSCTKMDKKAVKPESESVKGCFPGDPGDPPVTEPCPACGMG